MITVHAPNTTVFSNNGLGVLEPLSAVLSVTINGAWSLEIEQPFDEDEKYKKLEKNNIIKVDNISIIREQESEYQLFRIYDTVRTLTTVRAIAFPVAFEATYDAIIEELNIAKKSATLALQDIMTYLSQHGVSKYSVTSDYSQEGVTIRQKKGKWASTNLIAAISGSDDGSIINKWGGEVAYDNYHIVVNGRLGTTTSYDLRYGKNLEGLSVDVDTSGVVTRFYPVSDDNVRLKRMEGTTEVSYVDSPYHLGDYPFIRSAFVKAPYKLIDTTWNTGEPHTDAQIKTHDAQTALVADVQAVAVQLWNALNEGNTWHDKWYEPEWVKSIMNDAIAQCQKDITANITHPTWKALIQNCIKEGLSYIKDQDIPDFYWELVTGSTDTYHYTNGLRTIANQYYYVDRKFSWFNASGNYEPWWDISSMDWIQPKGSNAKKKYGDNQRYYAKNTYVYIYNQAGDKFCEYWFDDDGYWDNVSETETDWDWHDEGTYWWFGESGATESDKSKYAHDCWLWINKGTAGLYYFDSKGHLDSSLTKNAGWSWQEVKSNGLDSNAGKYYFGSTNKDQYKVLIENQWLKVDGEWRKFKPDGTLTDMKVLKNQFVNLLSTNLASAISSTIDTQQGYLYTQLYSDMEAYCGQLYDEGADLPVVNVTANLVDLSKTTEYNDILEDVNVPDGWWDCDEYWKTRNYIVQFYNDHQQFPAWEERGHAKYDLEWNCACLCRYRVPSGQDQGLYYAIIAIGSTNTSVQYYTKNSPSTPVNGREYTINGKTYWLAFDGYFPMKGMVNEEMYPTLLNVRAGTLHYLDYESAHSGTYGTEQEVIDYFLRVANFQTEKQRLGGIRLGDDVMLRDFVHQIYDKNHASNEPEYKDEVKERVVGLKYDCIKGYNTEVTISDPYRSFIIKSTGKTYTGKLDNLNIGDGVSAGGATVGLIAGENIEIDENGVIKAFGMSGDVFGGTEVSYDPSITTGDLLGTIYINGVAHGIYADASGSDVSITPRLQSGTKVADYNIDGVAGALYAPTPVTYNDFAGGSHGLVPAVSTHQGKFLKDDGTWEIPDSGTDVEVTAYYQSGNKVATIEVDGVEVDIYTPKDISTDILPIHREGYAYVCGSNMDYTVDYNTGVIDTYPTGSSQSDKKLTIVRTIPIPTTVSKIRYRVDLTDCTESSGDTWNFVIGIKSTLDTVNYADLTDLDWIAYRAYPPSEEGTIKEGEIAFTLSQQAYLYICANSWDATVELLEMVELTSAGELGDLEDVGITNPTNGQVLKFNSTTQKWENANESGGGASNLNDLSDVTLSNLSDGQVLTYIASQQKWKNVTPSGGGGISVIFNMNSGIVAQPGGSYIQTALDIPITAGILFVSLYDVDNNKVGNAFVYHGGTGDVSVNVTGIGTIKITPTTAGMSSYSGSYRYIYAKISTQLPVDSQYRY